MRLKGISLDNVGPFDHATFTFPDPGPDSHGELVLFEGPNGSGKTTILDAVATVINPQGVTFRGRTQGLRREADWIARFRSRDGLLELRIEAEDGEKPIAVVWSNGQITTRSESSPAMEARRAELWSASVSAEVALDWAVFSFSAHQPSPVVGADGPRTLREPPLDGALMFGRGRAGAPLGQLLINLEFERIQAASYASEGGARAEERKEIARTRREALLRIQSALGRVLNRSVVIDFPPGQLHASITFDGEDIPVDLLGEGMRSSFAWISDLLYRLHQVTWKDAGRSPLDQDFWLLLDEIDESLHPTLQARLYPTLRELFPNARIYATTHSPFVVASATSGTVFPIRPDPKTHHVSGEVVGRLLAPGQSLEYVVTDIFEGHAGFIDEQTRRDLTQHKDDVRALQQQKEIDWPTFLQRRARLMGLNDEVRAVVSMQEVPIRAKVAEKVFVGGEGTAE